MCVHIWVSNRVWHMNSLHFITPLSNGTTNDRRTEAKMIDSMAAPSFFLLKKGIKLIQKTDGKRKGVCA